jgi:hypothetical protein
MSASRFLSPVEAISIGEWLDDVCRRELHAVDQLFQLLKQHKELQRGGGSQEDEAPWLMKIRTLTLALRQASPHDRVGIECEAIFRPRAEEGWG